MGKITIRDVSLAMLVYLEDCEILYNIKYYTYLRLK